jgi:protein-S-isoprenylcysteine O-methyltransferase Ste14
MQNILERTMRNAYFEIISGLALAGLYSLFLYRHIQALQEGFSPASFIVVCMEGLLVLFFLTRHRAKDRSTDPQQLFFALLGTFLPLGFRPIGTAIAGETGSALIVLGSILALVSYLSLNRSFGMSPSLRKIKTSGLYRIVRHPIYMSYFISYTGYSLLAWHPVNVALIALWIYAQSRRVVFEEQILSQTEEYRAYKEGVRWRFIPGVI